METTLIIVNLITISTLIASVIIMKITPKGKN